jgi:pimeloyl-ACP methyl ester carboxylesterase
MAKNKKLIFVSSCIIVGLIIWLMPSDDNDPEVINYSVDNETVIQSKYPGTSNKVTFEQRVITLTPNNASSDSTVFFVLGNEGIASKEALVHIYKSYNKPKDIIFMMAEHRGYGQSVTNENQDIPDYVTVNNALLDYKKIIDLKRTHYTGKWIIAGYSYGGALAIAYADKYPDTFDVALASSAPIDWPLYIPQYAAQVNENLPVELLTRLHEHGQNLSLKPENQKDGKRIELLTSIIVGLSQNKAPESILTVISTLSYLSTDLFLDALEKMSPAPAFDWVTARTSDVAPARAQERVWYTWMYQQCNELGTFFIGAPFVYTKQQYIDKCKQAFKSEQHSFTQTKWDISSQLNHINKPIIVVSGGKDPWINLGVKPGHHFKNIQYVYSKDWFHCPDLNNPDAAKQTFDLLLKSIES